MKTKKKMLALAMAIIASAGLAACSHSNPLKQYSHAQVARDLLSSATESEMQLHLAKHRYQAGNYYYNCMEGKNPAATCNKLYAAMQSELKEKYKGVSVSDITDKKLWSFLKDYYQGDLFNRLPEED